MSLAKRIAQSLRLSASEPHPLVVRALQQAIRVLEKAKIPFWPMGGIAVNKFGVGRPTKGIDFLVPRERWEDAVNALKSISIDQEIMGLKGEPASGAILTSKDGVKIEVFPTGFTAREIATLGVNYRDRVHPGSNIPAVLPNEDGELLELITRKLSSYLSSTRRLSDLGDVQRLIEKNGLDKTFASTLPASLRPTFLKVLNNKI